MRIKQKHLDLADEILGAYRDKDNIERGKAARNHWWSAPLMTKVISMAIVFKEIDPKKGQQ